ncbi:MAG: acyl-CoA desaturase, partial [Bdellovibrionota bacterium]|nr:acyl-CoA desaturase [Bdellovibrionota bacterium]
MYLTVLIFLIIHWYLSLFCQSFFLHRYAAHRMFKMNSFFEKFFYI